MKFKIGQNVFVTPCHLAESEDTIPAVAIVGGVSEDGNVMRLHVDNPPEWQLAMLRERGIFSGKNPDILLSVWRDHKGQWTEYQTLGHFEIEDAELAMGFAKTYFEKYPKATLDRLHRRLVGAMGACSYGAARALFKLLKLKKE